MFLACATGKHFATATLTYRKAGKIYLVFTFKLVAVRAIADNPSGSATPDEAVTLNYGTRQISIR